MKGNQTAYRVLDRAEVKVGIAYKLRQLPCGVKFKHNGQEYETITYPPIQTATSGLMKRDVWNLEQKKLVQILYTEKVVAN